jgi:hypothetical protein
MDDQIHIKTRHDYIANQIRLKTRHKYIADQSLNPDNNAVLYHTYTQENTKQESKRYVLGPNTDSFQKNTAQQTCD